MGSPRNLDVAGDRYRHRAEELKADSFAVSRTHPLTLKYRLMTHRAPLAGCLRTAHLQSMCQMCE